MKKRNTLITLAVLVVVTGLVFSPVLQNDFVNWDDPNHLLNNPALWSLSADNLAQIFGTSLHDTYIPLTLFSFALEHSLFGYNPFYYHLDNLILHLVVVVLIYFIGLLLGFDPKASVIAALLFGVHPMHVEAVAWITARKDVLYSSFYLLSVFSHLKYIKERHQEQYIATLIFGLMAILAKPMALSLPLILWLCDWYYQRMDTKQAIIEKVPIFLYIIPITWLTYVEHARVPGQNVIEALLTWVWTFVFYLKKFIAPIVLVPLYDLPQPVSLLNIEFIISLGLFIGLIALIYRFRKNRLWIFAVGWYVLSIFFLLRFDQTADRTIVADRFMYLPSLGLCFLCGYGLSRGIEKLPKQASWLILVLVLGLLSFKTFEQTKVWKNSETLWSSVIAIFPEQWEAYHNRGNYYHVQKEYERALVDFDQAIHLNPDHSRLYLSRGLTLMTVGKWDQALRDYNYSIELKSDSHSAYNNRGILFRKRGQYAEAIRDFDQALELHPTFAAAYNNRGNVYSILRKHDRALEDFNSAIEHNPRLAMAYNNRGIVYFHWDQIRLAVVDYNKALSLDPTYAKAYGNRGLAYSKMEEDQLALADFSKAIELDSSMSETYYNRARTYLKLGQPDLAAADLKIFEEFHPNHPLANQLRTQIFN